MPLLFSDRSEVAGAPLWHLGAIRPPAGKYIPLAAGREVFVRELAARKDRGGPPVLLLHGWFASGGLNWIRAFEPLSETHRVCAPDLHRHARAEAARARRRPRPHSRRPFEIERCADDMAELLDLLYPGEPAIVIGYSLGGMVAQALWRRHPDRVRGLVLGATSAAPVPVSRGRHPFSGLMQLARESSLIFDRATRTPRAVGRRMVRSAPAALREQVEANPFGHWAASEFAHHHWPTVLDAGRAIAEFDTRSWIGEIDVPTSILLTERDSFIPPKQQHAMAEAIGHAHIQAVDAGHFACVRNDFGARLVASCIAIAPESQPRPKPKPTRKRKR